MLTKIFWTKIELRHKFPLTVDSVNQSTTNGLRETFETATPLRIHSLCRKNYTQKRSIVAEKRKYACLEEVVGLKTLQLRSNTPRTYDIKTDCMFCSEPITLDIKTPRYKSSKQRRNLGIPSHSIESRKVVDVDSQSDRVIDMAASVILNDIRMTVYDCEQYELPETTENGDKFIPSSLKHFLHNLLDCNGKSRTVSDRRTQL